MSDPIDALKAKRMTTEYSFDLSNGITVYIIAKIPNSLPRPEKGWPLAVVEAANALADKLAEFGDEVPT